MYKYYHNKYKNENNKKYYLWPLNMSFNVIFNIGL